MQAKWLELLGLRAQADCTVSYVAVPPVLDDVAEGALDPLVAGEVQGVGRAGPQHRDVEAPEGPQDAFGANDSLQGLVNASVLGLRVRL